MQLSIAIDDAKAFMKPWTFQAPLTLLPDTELVEASCDSHDKTVEHRRVELVIEPPSPRRPTTRADGDIRRQAPAGVRD
jgi:hypothetical protein